MDIKIPCDVYNILNMLNKNGYEAYIVGGGVRDMLLCKNPSDFDITTNALPTQVQQVFKKYKTLDYAKKYGTITILLNNNSYEITTYRTENSYKDNRHPENISFSKTYTDDVSRRDFTINSILCDKDKNIIDIYNGLYDIKNNLIRTINNPNDRFSEDALRILRCIRFSSVLNFQIEDNTKSAVFLNKHLLKNISYERINDEFIKIILSDNYKKIMGEYREVFNVFIEDFSKKAYLSCDIINDLAVRLSVIFSQYDINKVNDLLYKLKFNKKIITQVIKIISTKQMYLNCDKICIKKLLNKYDYDLSQKIIYFHFHMDKIKQVNKFLNKLNEIINNGECYKISQLKINGNDIKNNFSISENKIGDILRLILTLVVEDKLKNDKNLQLSFVDYYDKIW